MKARSIKIVYLFIYFLTLISCSNNIQYEINEINIVYNSKKYNEKKYDVHLLIFMSIHNKSKNPKFIKINDIDTLYMNIKNKKYMLMLHNTYNSKIELPPKQYLTVEYKSNYNETSNKYDNKTIENEIKYASFKNQNKIKISPIEKLVIKPKLEAYIKNTIYTPNGTKIENIGN